MPNYDEFCADEGNIRKAFNAVVSLFHMTDNYFNFYKRRADAKVAGFNDLRDFQVYMGGHTPYFNDVQSIANAYKHLYTNSEIYAPIFFNNKTVGVVEFYEGAQELLARIKQGMFKVIGK